MGNDIVDVNAPEAKGKSGDPRFLERVLTVPEQRAVARSFFPDRLLWAFWAAKETAYKAASKLDPNISSVPRRYEVSLEEEGASGPWMNKVCGIVRMPKGIVPVRVLFHPEYVHCIGGCFRFGSLDDMTWEAAFIEAVPGSKDIHPPSERESFAARQLAARALSGLWCCDPDDIRIERSNHPAATGFPVAYRKGQPARLDISLSHDGRFVAFAACGLAPKKGIHP